FFFFFQAEDGIRDGHVTGVQTCALPILAAVLLSGVSFKPLLARFFAVLPFALLMGVSAWFSHLPTAKMLDIMGKALCSIAAMARSEERRVGKEWGAVGGPCRCTHRRAER